VVHSKNSLLQQKFHKKLYRFNRHSQLRSVMEKWSNSTSRVGQNIRLRP